MRPVPTPLPVLTRPNNRDTSPPSRNWLHIITNGSNRVARFQLRLHFFLQSWPKDLHNDHRCTEVYPHTWGSFWSATTPSLLPISVMSFNAPKTSVPRLILRLNVHIPQSCAMSPHRTCLGLSIANSRIDEILSFAKERKQG
jgi:hypothetical protein